jgi:hypothetical protein
MGERDKQGRNKLQETPERPSVFENICEIFTPQTSENPTESQSTDHQDRENTPLEEIIPAILISARQQTETSGVYPTGRESTAKKTRLMLTNHAQEVEAEVGRGSKARRN